MKQLKISKSYIHNITNKKYYVESLCKLKVDMGWFDCVVYTNHSGEKFVRKVEDFKENFSEY